MTYSTELREQISAESSTLSNPWDSHILQAAQEIYDTYARLHGKISQDPIGVAVDPKTRRGQVLFTKLPILLPGERFISMEQLNQDEY